MPRTINSSHFFLAQNSIHEMSLIKRVIIPSDPKGNEISDIKTTCKGFAQLQSN